jgi:hypothetical protein
MTFQYRIKAHPTVYKGTTFRSRLEARWAAFFDLAGWTWQYEPIDLVGWSPDFLVSFPCGHSECYGRHSLLIDVKPFLSIEEFEGHPCMDYAYGFYLCDPDAPGIPADASGAFGLNPDVTHWEMAHGAGGGDENLLQWVRNAWDLWNQTGYLTQYKPK